jgi:ABC-type nickel/cobalt efflux system permease component RcnA
VWAARKVRSGCSCLRWFNAIYKAVLLQARAFSATHSASAVGHESSSTEPGELKEYKLPPGYGARAGHDSDSSTDSDDSTRRGKDSKRKRKKEKKHKHHKRDKSDKHHKKSHKRDRADSEDASKSRKKAES